MTSSFNPQHAFKILHEGRPIDEERCGGCLEPKENSNRCPNCSQYFICADCRLCKLCVLAFDDDPRKTCEGCKEKIDGKDYYHEAPLCKGCYDAVPMVDCEDCGEVKVKKRSSERSLCRTCRFKGAKYY